MPGITSSHLREKQEQIMILWEARALREVASAGTTQSLALRDTLPIYLDHLAEALALNRKMDISSVLARNEESIRIGRLHGADRAGNSSYVLTEVILEFHILREVIFQVLESDAPLADIQRDIILDSIEQAVNDAAVKFSEVHLDIQQKFINILTHDLKTPIAATLMNAQLISRHPDNRDLCASATARITSSMKRLESMIHDLLDASKVRAGEPLSLHFARCDLNALVREVVTEQSAIHGDRFVLDSPVAVAGYWGPDGFRRAVENLLGNAVKYSTPDSPIRISVRTGKSSVTLAVHNEGPPIPKPEIPLLFQQYRRAKSAQESFKTGWGLGLALVKGVVEAHKGTVRVESSAGQGTSFILDIPFAPVPLVGELRSTG